MLKLKLSLLDSNHDEPAQLALAARRNLTTRLGGAVLVVAAALPVMPAGQIVVWTALMLCQFGLELSLTTRRWRALPTVSGIPVVWGLVALLGGSVNALGAALFWQVNTPTARLFAIIMICVLMNPLISMAPVGK